MRKMLDRIMPQPITAIVFCGFALLLLTLSWVNTPVLNVNENGLQMLLVAAFLSALVIQANLHPIHIRYHTKLSITTPPLYLMAVLLPPPMAALMIGVSTLVSQLATRRTRGSLFSDMATAVGRWTIIGLIGAAVAHSGASDQLTTALVLAGTALVMFATDVLTAAFEIAPMSGESPWPLMLTLLREASLMEGVQYLLGMLGALAAWQQVWALLLLVLPTIIVYLAFKNAKEMHDGTRMLLESMADAVDLRDAYTGGHSRRVTEYAMCILKEMNIWGPEAELIKLAARVHDIGKIGIPDAILNKPDKLTPEEKQIMDSHPAQGAELLSRYSDFARGRDIVRHHHERWDGQGYPSRLKGADIPFGARVIAVADSYDAMTSTRPYRPAMSQAQAMRILREGRGTQWDTIIVDAFLQYLAKEQEKVAPTTNTVAMQTAGAPA